MDEKKLLKYAVDYLSKYDSSKNNLINILKRKIFKLKTTGIEKGKLINSIDNIVLKLEKNNLINDYKYTLSKIHILSNSGKSKNFISTYLVRKGIDKLEINSIFQKTFDENNNWELESARKFVRKKKLIESNDTYEKKLAKLARAGFSYDICKKVLN